MKAGHWILVAGLLALVASGLLFVNRPEEARPQRKSGLWEMTSRFANGSPPTTSQLCIDQAEDDVIQGVGSTRMKECTEITWKREGEGIIAHTVCKIEGSTATADVVLTGDFETAYHNEVFVVFDPPLHGNDQMSVVQEARWIGACPDDLKPGDMVNPDGSIASAAGAAEAPPAAEAPAEPAPVPEAPTPAPPAPESPPEP